MEEKDIDINNEDQILKECNFDYFYNCEECSRELCMFYNDMFREKNNFNIRQAMIDLGRIAITLNQQDKRIKELEQENKKANINNYLEDYFLVEKENQQLKQKLAEYECLMNKYNVEDLGHLDIMLFVLSGETKYQLAKLKQQLAEKDEEIEKLKKEIKEPEEIWNANLAELKEEVKQKLAQEFTEKIDGMLKEKVKEKTIDLNNQIRLMQESQQIEIDKRQREVNSYLKVIKAYNSNENLKAIEQLEKLFNEVENIYHTNEMDKMWLLDYIKATIFDLKGNAENEKCIK